MNFSATYEIVSRIVARDPVNALFIAVSGGLGLYWHFWHSKKAAKQIHSDSKMLYSQHHEYVSVKPADFPWVDHAYYDMAERELTALGFRKLDDRENVTLSRVYPNMRTFVRVMVSADGKTAAGIYRIKMRGWMRLIALLGGIRPNKGAVDLESELSDGTFACTANVLGRDFSTSVEGISRVHLPEDAKPADVVAKHREHVATLAQTAGAPLATLRTVEDCHELGHRIQDLKNRAKAETGYVDIGQFERCAAKQGSPAITGKIRKHLEEIEAQEHVS